MVTGLHSQCSQLWNCKKIVQNVSKDWAILRVKKFENFTKSLIFRHAKLETLHYPVLFFSSLNITINLEDFFVVPQSHCGNLANFLPLRFFVNQKCAILIVIEALKFVLVASHRSRNVPKLTKTKIQSLQNCQTFKAALESSIWSSK